MYAIKVETGTERIAVRQYSSSFTLTYTSAAESSMGRKMLVLPGFIFTRKIMGNVIKIPDKDWKVLEAISDPHPSTLDVKTQQIIDGPLKGLLILRINPALKSVCIRARILDEVRDYWLAVRFQSSTTQDIAQPVDERNTKPKALKKEAPKMAKEKIVFTEEQLDTALARAAEIGIHKAAAEGGIPWQSLQGYAKKLGKLEEVSLKKKTKASPAPAEKAEAPEKKKPSATKGKKKVQAASVATPAEEKKAVSTPAAPATTVEEKKKAVSAPTAPAKEKKPEIGDAASSALAIENAVLKKENEQLRAQVEKLKKALAELI